jgi:hypothetical protein
MNIPTGRTSPWLAVVLAFAWTSAWPSSVGAECIALATTPAEWLRHRSVIFVGDVVAIRDEQHEDHHYQVVTFDVVEAFRGVRRGTRTLRMLDPYLDGFRFIEESQRVFVVAGTFARNRHSTACSPTRVFRFDDPFLEELRRLTMR